MDIENATYAQLLHLRRSYRQDLAAVEAKIAEHRTRQLFARKQKQNEVLQQVNREFFNFFGGDPFLNKKLMAPVRNMSFFISYGLNKRLNELGIFYVWQIMLRTEKYFQDHIGGKETAKLKTTSPKTACISECSPTEQNSPAGKRGCFCYFFSSSTTLICSSSSCCCVTKFGACIIKSCALPFNGNKITSRIIGSSKSSITSRSTP